MNFFTVGQELVRADNEKIASFTRNYVYANFLFDEPWKDLTKYALFVLPNKTQIIEPIGLEQEAEIIVPFNALTETYFQLSVFGKDDNDGLLTSTQEKVIIYPSGFTKDVMEQIFNEEVFMLENSEEDGELRRLEKDIFWFIPNKKLLHRNEHLYD